MLRKIVVAIFIVGFFVCLREASADVLGHDIYGREVILHDDGTWEYTNKSLDSECRKYAERAVAQNRTNLKLHCGYTGPRWHSNFNTHYQWCMHVSPQARLHETRARSEQLAACSRNVNSNKSRECREYANRAVAQNRTNLKLHCGYTGPRWHSDFNTHYQWCMRASAQQRQYETRMRSEQLAACSNRGGPPQRTTTYEMNIDRMGMDYKNFDLPVADYRLCARACLDEAKCKAWTYVKPNTIQGPKPRCWLKYSVPPKVTRSCCVSGVIEIRR